MSPLRSGAALLAVALAASLSTESAGRPPKTVVGQPVKKPPRAYFAQPLPVEVVAKMLRSEFEASATMIEPTHSLLDDSITLAPVDMTDTTSLRLGRRDTPVLLDLTAETGPAHHSIERQGAFQLTIDPLGRQPTASAVMR